MVIDLKLFLLSNNIVPIKMPVVRNIFGLLKFREVFMCKSCTPSPYLSIPLQVFLWRDTQDLAIPTCWAAWDCHLSSVKPRGQHYLWDCVCQSMYHVLCMVSAADKKDSCMVQEGRKCEM